MFLFVISVCSFSGAFYCAVTGEKARVEVLQFLLDKGASINAKSEEGFTALHLAVRGTGNAEVVRFLPENGADVHAKSNEGETPLQRAEDEYKEMLRAALWAGNVSTLFVRV